MPTLNKCHNISDLQRRAKKILPSPMYQYLEGGADDEWSLRRNSSAFDDYALMPRYLRDVSVTETSTSCLGMTMGLPLILAPTGMSRLFHHEKEFGVSRAAERFGLLYSLSTMATASLEEIANATSAPKMFQIYILRDRELTREFVRRCKDSGYHSLCLTVDTPLAGNRERDFYSGMSLPPRITLKGFFSYGTSFRWLYNLLRDPDFKLANVAHRADAMDQGTTGLIEYVNSQFDRTVTWEDAAWLAEQWDGPFVIKGLQSVDDVKMARDIGASAVMVSNHGGRQLEGTPAPLECIPAIREAIGDELELIVDGGVRRGTHIIKALALGANACSIGRPYLYGLAAGGQRGVEHGLEILKTELERSMALLGVNSIEEIEPAHVQRLV